MQNRRSLGRWLIAVGAAAACAAVLDAAVLLAADGPATRPVVIVVAPTTRATTGPALVGGSIGSDYARPMAPAAKTPTLTTPPGGAAVGNEPAPVSIDRGIDSGERANTSVRRAGSSTQPAHH